MCFTNCMFLIQPMDQGVIKSRKFHCLDKFMREPVEFRAPKGSENFKKTVLFISEAWEPVMAPVLMNALSNSTVKPATCFLSIIHVLILFFKCSIQDQGSL